MIKYTQSYSDFRLIISFAFFVSLCCCFSANGSLIQGMILRHVCVAKVTFVSLLNYHIPRLTVVPVMQTRAQVVEPLHSYSIDFAGTEWRKKRLATYQLKRYQNWSFSLIILSTMTHRVLLVLTIVKQKKQQLHQSHQRI